VLGSSTVWLTCRSRRCGFPRSAKVRALATRQACRRRTLAPKIGSSTRASLRVGDGQPEHHPTPPIGTCRPARVQPDVASDTRRRSWDMNSTGRTFSGTQSPSLATNADKRERFSVGRDPPKDPESGRSISSVWPTPRRGGLRAPEAAFLRRQRGVFSPQLRAKYPLSTAIF
jgi:hypothetical protein